VREKKKKKCSAHYTQKKKRKRKRKIHSTHTTLPSSYFLGLGHSFVKYPRKLVVIDFSDDPDGEGGPILEAGTSDGQAIELEVSVYLQLNETQLPDLYKDFNENFADKLVRIAQSTLKNTAVLFNTTEYFTRRQEIAEKMALNVDAEFKKVFAYVTLLQLRGVGLPSGFEQRLVDNVVALQEQTKAIFERQLAIVDAQTQVIEARAQGQITEILGQASADALRIREKGQADGTRLLVDIEATSYEQLRRELGFTNEQLFQYLFYTRKVQQATAKDQILVGLGDGSRVNLNLRSPTSQ
jgi:regulator of protease activity HflC (stomatin/prohibitin superfamily)